jgi:hypothetical protein
VPHHAPLRQLSNHDVRVQGVSDFEREARHAHPQLWENLHDVSIFKSNIIPKAAKATQRTTAQTTTERPSVYTAVFGEDRPSTDFEVNVAGVTHYEQPGSTQRSSPVEPNRKTPRATNHLENLFSSCFQSVSTQNPFQDLPVPLLKRMVSAVLEAIIDSRHTTSENPLGGLSTEHVSLVSRWADCSLYGETPMQNPYRLAQTPERFNLKRPCFKLSPTSIRYKFPERGSKKQCFQSPSKEKESCEDFSSAFSFSPAGQDQLDVIRNRRGKPNQTRRTRDSYDDESDFEGTEMASPSERTLMEIDDEKAVEIDIKSGSIRLSRPCFGKFNPAPNISFVSLTCS